MRSVLEARSSVRLLRLAALLALVGLLIGAGSASAGKGVVSVFGASGSGDGQFSSAASTATNLSSGDVYGVDPGNSRVEQFGSDGSFVRAWGWGVADGSTAAQTCTSSCQAGIAGSGDGQFDNPQGIAVDQSDGSVYVVDGNNSRVEKFDSTGGFQSQFGGAGSGDGEFTGPQGIAVDPSDGSVYVVDSGDHRIEKFDNAGVYQSQFGSEGSGDGQFETPTRVAVDSTGQVYVIDSGNSRIERFTTVGTFDQVFDPTDVFLPSEIAIGPGNDHLYVAQWAQDFSEQRVVEIDGSGTLVDTHGTGSGANNPSGLALSTSSQQIYLADGANTRIFILDDLTAPTVTLDPPTGVTSTSASLSGSVNPNGPPAVGWRFETSTDDANWTPAATDQDAGSGTSDISVAQSLSELIPNTTYYVRLVATRPFNTPAISSGTQFTTHAVAPDVETEPANDISTTHATLRGLINPHNSTTTYYFEYGTTTSYGTSTPVGQDAALAIPGPVQEVNSNGVQQRHDGLQPNTTYHFRLSAHNQAGTVTGQDQTFTTTISPAPSPSKAGIPGRGFLPDERGWEQVSSTDKQGNDVMADSGRTRASASGDAAMFTSLGSFADVQGAGVAAEYMGVRNAKPGTSGWSTRGITPPQRALAFQSALTDFDPRYDGELSPDLSRGVFRTASPLTDAPSVANVGNLYLRDDLRTSETGAYQLLTDCPVCGTTPLNFITTGDVTARLPRLAGASVDFAHVIFESVHHLTTDATADGSPTSPVNLYEWDHATVRLVGILPDGSPAPESQAGPGAWNQIYMPRTISADGSRIFFADNSAGSEQTGRLYMRVNHSTTAQLNVSERTDCADHDPCAGTPEPDPNGPQRARFENASVDGARSFFTSSEMLTDDAVGGAQNLYMYNATAGPGHHLSLLSQNANGVSGVIGVSDDGHYVYFLAGGQPVTGQPITGSPGFFLWHDGIVSYIGELADPARDAFFNLPTKWGFPDRFAGRVTPDGRHLLFTSSTGDGLTGYNHGSCGPAASPHVCEELYLYGADDHVLRCVSCDPGGAPGSGDAVDNRNVRVSGSGTTGHVNHAVSDDGRRVFFGTADALVLGDANGKEDVYEYDVPTGTVHLISSGRDPSDSYFMDASTSGNDVFFLTRQQLVGWDHDQNYDLYDARVDGGVPEPVGPPPTCSGESCQGALSAAPGTLLAGSVSFHGSGNVKSKPLKKPARCKRGTMRKKVRGKVRCVKSKRHPKKKAKRAQRRGK